MYVFKFPKQYNVPRVKCNANPPIKENIPSAFWAENVLLNVLKILDQQLPESMIKCYADESRCFLYIINVFLFIASENCLACQTSFVRMCRNVDVFPYFQIYITVNFNGNVTCIVLVGTEENYCCVS